MNRSSQHHITIGQSQNLSTQRTLWGLVAGGAVGALGGSLFAGSLKKKNRYGLMNYVGYGALIGAGVMGALALLRSSNQ